MSYASSASVPEPRAMEAELALPREPGVFRTFWRRHPLLFDIILVIICLMITSADLILSIPDEELVVPIEEVPFNGGILVLVLLRYLACFALFFRRRWPLIPFALGVLAHVLSIPWMHTTESIAVPIALYSMAVYISSRLAWTAFGIGAGVIAIGALIYTFVSGVALEVTIGSIAAYIIGGLIGTLIGANIGNRRRYLGALIDRSRQLLIERDQQAQLAAAGERTRIAREMHDIVSHNLTVIVALADGAVATQDRDRARAVTEQIAISARSALREMRSMLGVLRDPEAASDTPLTPIDERSILDAVTAAQRAGFPATLLTRGSDAAPAPVRFAASRIVQEALTNAIRHAPHASFITVEVDSTAEEMRLHIRNDGIRAHTLQTPSTSGGFGLRGLHERAAHLGGTLAAGLDDKGVWGVSATLPFGDISDPLSES